MTELKGYTRIAEFNADDPISIGQTTAKASQLWRDCIKIERDGIYAANENIDWQHYRETDMYRPKWVGQTRRSFKDAMEAQDREYEQRLGDFEKKKKLAFEKFSDLAVDPNQIVDAIEARDRHWGERIKDLKGRRLL